MAALSCRAAALPAVASTIFLPATGLYQFGIALIQFNIAQQIIQYLRAEAQVQEAGRFERPVVDPVAASPHARRACHTDGLRCGCHRWFRPVSTYRARHSSMAERSHYQADNCRAGYSAASMPRKSGVAVLSPAAASAAGLAAAKRARVSGNAANSASGSR